jgi:hypothetical protein
MNRGLAWTGSAVAGAVLLALGTDFAARQGRRPEILVPTPEGFHQVLPGVGPVEIGFSGPVVFTTDQLEEADGGTAVRVPGWRMEGNDPRPQGSGALITQALIVAPPTGRGRGLTVRAPQAWIALVPDKREIRLDLDRTWRLTNPVLTLPDYLPGRTLTATADGEALLDPRAERVNCPGHFRMEAEDLVLDGAELNYDAVAKRLRFQPWNGEVRWSMTDATGRVFRGRSDAPGELLPTADGGLELRFDPGLRGVRATLPGVAGDPASVITSRAFSMHLDPAGESSWQPRSARAAGPVFLSSARIAFEGSDAEMAWNDAGALSEILIHGPVAARPWDSSFAVATARTSARLDPLTGMLIMDGRCLALDGNGSVSADSAQWDGKELNARGDIVAQGAVGLAQADEMTAVEAGGLTARGNVRVFPQESLVRELSGPALSATPEGLLEMNEGFRAHGLREQEQWSVVGVRAASRLEPDGARRTDADGDLEYFAPGIVIRAARLRQLDEERFLLEGQPARASMELSDGSVATSEFRRAESDAEGLSIEGSPLLKVPAAALGLLGPDVTLTARSGSRLHATGAWLLEREVKVDGALQTSADAARWSPAEGLWLERRFGPTTASGTLADGRSFTATARKLGVDGARTLVMEGDAAARLVEVDGQAHVLTAENAHLGETGGWAETRARFDSPLGRAAGERMDWRTQEGRIVYLKIVGEAALAQGDMSAEGAVIEMDEETGWMSIQGSPERAAHLLPGDGRNLRAEWLKYNVRSGLLESGPVRVDQPQ